MGKDMRDVLRSFRERMIEGDSYRLKFEGSQRALSKVIAENTENVARVVELEAAIRPAEGLPTWEELWGKAMYALRCGDKELFLPGLDPYRVYIQYELKDQFSKDDAIAFCRTMNRDPGTGELLERKTEAG